MPTWQRLTGATEHYAEITATAVLIGSRGRASYSDNATSCSHAEFLAGALHDVVRDGLGEAIMAEMLVAVRRFPSSGP
jgi:hypothetical protein